MPSPSECPAEGDPAEQRLLLLAPSSGFGGGTERMADLVAVSWPGPVSRVDLYRPDEVAVPRGNLRAKLRFARRALLAAARRPPAVVVALHVNFLPVALPLGRVFGARVAMFGLGTEVWGSFPWLTRQLVARCPRLLAISSFTAHWMARRAGIDVDRILVLRPAVERRLLDESGALQARKRAPEAAPPCLLTVTRLAPEHRYKGCFDIAAAMPRVVAETPELRWVVVGGGMDLLALRSRCEALGVSHAVELVGGVSDAALAAAYRRADVFVLPSRADPVAVPPIGEGFGLVFAEAGAFSVPSIASRSGGGSLEFVRDQETGLTVPPGDPEALARAILLLVRDARLRDRLGTAARELVESRHQQSDFSAGLWNACR